MSTSTNGAGMSKTKPCRLWAAQGRCRFGSNCKFSHDLVRIVENEVDDAVRHVEDTHNLHGPSASIPSVLTPANLQPKMKMGICKEWKAKRQCPMGTQCQFNHPNTLDGAGSDQGHFSNVGGRSGQAKKSTSKGKGPLGRPVEFQQQPTILSLEQLQEMVLEKKRRRESLAIEEQLREQQRIAKLQEVKEEQERLQLARKAESERREHQERLAREAAAKEEQERRQEQQAREATVIEQCIILDSSLVTFAAGLNILHVIPGFDLCKIVIKNLPADARRQEIADLFTQQGLQTHDFHITQYPTATSPDAVVLVNEEYGQAIAAGLEGIDFRGVALSFVMSENAIDTGMGEAANKLPFVLVSWDAPSDTVIATYTSMEEARNKVGELNMKNWRGRQIRVFMNQPPPGSSAARHFFNPASIKILGLPYGTSIDYELFGFLGSTNVRKLKSAIFDFPTSFDTIRRILSLCDGVQMDTYEIMNNGDRGEAKVRVEFVEWEDAKLAHTSVLRMFAGPPKFRPWVPQQPLRYTIKIPRQQYDAQKRQWDELSEKKKDVDAYVQAKIGARGDVFVQVLGQDKKAIGTLKVRVERMVAGEKLDSATCWHSSFMSVEGRRFLNRIYEQKKVSIRHDFKSKSLRAYGEPRRIEEARGMVQQEVERLSQNEITRDIFGRGSVGFFVREGLGKLTELLGDGNVKLDLASRPCKITVKGGEEAKHHLQRLLEESRAKAAFHEGAGLPNFGVTETCPICMDEVSNPEELACGHTYCSGCLKLFLTSAADGKKFPIVCIANDASCNVPLSIPFIRRFLPVQAFQGLVEAAFLLHLDQHAQELKYCTTPDCKQIYRHRTDVAVLKCPSCFSTICAACDEDAHEDMTCAERRLHSNPEEQERLNNALATANGYKKCPQCSIWIEKTEGCNHMTCKCGAHICWRCMGIFSVNEIYEHMNTVHNGIYEREPPAMNPNNEANFVAEQVRAMNELERQRNARARVHDYNYNNLRIGGRPVPPPPPPPRPAVIHRVECAGPAPARAPPPRPAGILRMEYAAPAQARPPPPPPRPVGILRVENALPRVPPAENWAEQQERRARELRQAAEERRIQEERRQRQEELNRQARRENRGGFFNNCVVM
ncbi:hypothetical protein D9613_007285 [Agrocybe pediades]|uniref:RBR-type E3 ubiquitin transferase n=1 Tax=Agrocybe pediades TaxID=84607 RepID=A0A8H4QIW6_9AGAR|nr:hypothetical protein D9613_007285 [Agrocybe pediades]